MTGFAREQVLGLIPARGGSKGVPRKNIRPLLGKPLIAWTIEAALAAPEIGRVIVSTDDEEIADVARQYGAELPFLRPAVHAQDDTPDLPVLMHAVETLKETEGKTYAVVVWLRPTTPLRQPDDIGAALNILAESGADSVRSVSASKAHPYWMKTVTDGLLQPFVPGHDERNYPRRQMLPPAYGLNGVVDATRIQPGVPRATMWGEKIAAYIMPTERSVDIDTEADFAVAEALLKARAP